MATVDVTVKASKELHELGQGIANFLAKARKAGQDGFDANDISPILTAALIDIVPALDGVSLIADEFKDDLSASVMASAIVGAAIIKALVD